MHASKILLVILPILPCIKGSGVPLVVSPGLNISTTPSIAANLAGCNDLAGTIAPTIPCYNTLDVSSYLINYNLTSAEVCAPDELFSTCLLRAVYGVPGVSLLTFNTSYSSLRILKQSLTLISAAELRDGERHQSQM